MFALICNNFNADFAQQILIFSFKLKLYKNCFDSKNAKILFMHENEDHVINLKFKKKLSYDLFYTLSKNKLHILQRYLLKNLALNCIREFFNFVETLMMFIFKKNNSLRLYIDY